MMEIPAGIDCMRCPFLHWSNVIDEYVCDNMENGVGSEYPDHGLRSSACLAAYPNGATVTITPKEVK